MQFGFPIREPRAVGVHVFIVTVTKHDDVIVIRGNRRSDTFFQLSFEMEALRIAERPLKGS